jgi:hypothetical protein
MIGMGCSHALSIDEQRVFIPCYLKQLILAFKIQTAKSRYNRVKETANRDEQFAPFFENNTLRSDSNVGTRMSSLMQTIARACYGSLRQHLERLRTMF